MEITDVSAYFTVLMPEIWFRGSRLL